MKLAAIIPTRNDRPEFLAFALQQLNRQTKKPDIVMVVDDPPLTEDKDITWRYRTGIDRCKQKCADIIFFIEDDDWYSPKYIERMLQLWEENEKPDLFGIDSTTYYHLKIKSYITVNHPGRASMYNTMITKDFNIPKWCAVNDPYTDIHIWKFCQNKKAISCNEKLTLGIKHGQGLCGGHGHDPIQYQKSKLDKNLTYLKKFTGTDIDFYKKFIPFQNQIKFGIVITIYKRKDGKSPWYLKRCLQSVQAQTYKDYQVIVIGDNYTNDSEIKNIIPENFYYENNPIAYEREKYTGERLWCCGGLKSILKGLNKLKTDYLIMLDYDDYWSPDHLQSFADLKYFDFACTKSTHVKNILPRYTGTELVVPMIPKPCGMIKSSICWNKKTFPQLPRNVFEETGKDYPSDADFLKRLAEDSKEKKCFFVNKHTCFHETEGHCKTEFIHTPVKKVSVVIICYNQQNYIRKAIDSVLAQKTKHDLEIIISDDHSKDKTPEIIKEYVNKNSIIKYNQNKKNLGVTKNYQKAFSLCTGEFIAFCEGDDWWTDLEKIDKQVQYLEQNPDCSGCYHQFDSYQEEQKKLISKGKTKNIKKDIHQLIRELIGANFSTIIARKIVVDKINPNFYNQIAYDWLFLMALAEHGQIGFIGNSMSVRRSHNKGVWSGEKDKQGVILKHISNYDHFFNLKYTKDFQSLYQQQTRSFCHNLTPIPIPVPPPVKNIPVEIPVINHSDQRNLTVITCTGDRPEAFKLCKFWLERQTIKPNQWIVVDDGKVPMSPPANCQYIRREPKDTDPPHTLCLNLLEGLEATKGDQIIIFEDDDWYSPKYIETMLGFLNHYDMVGVGSLVFYSLRHPGWNYRPRSKQPPLYQTVFNQNVLPFMKHLCQSVYMIKGLAEKGLLDGQIWQQTGKIIDHTCAIVTEAFDSPMGKLKKGMAFYPPYPPFIQRRIGTPRVNYGSKPIKKYIYDPDKPIAVGIKNMPGREGLTQAQKSGLKFYTYDTDCQYLINLIGDDIKYYKEFINHGKEEITNR